MVIKLVQIDWFDSDSFQDTWTGIEDIKEYNIPSLCKSIGWLLNDGKEAKTIVAHIAFKKDNKTISQCSGDMMIPTRAIIKMKVLHYKFGIKDGK